jgi:ATP-dependent DNA helicase RecG
MNEITTYTVAELLTLLDDVESGRVERKRSFEGDTPDRARQAVCAFANDLPNYDRAGVLFIGAKDNGEPSGISINDELLLQISDMKTDGNILPLPVMTVEKRKLKGADMAVVTVYPSDAPPVKYKGRIWVRTGPRRSLASAQEERILNEKRRYRDLPFDLHPYALASLGDLSRTYFEDDYLPVAFAPDVLAENNRSYEERLASCRMIYSIDDPIPTFLGLITLGRKPQDFLPGAYIQFLRIAGGDLADPVADEFKISGRLSEMVFQIETKLKAHNRTAYDTKLIPHIVSHDYPPRAIQQIIYNAIMHRNYENTNAPVQVYWYDNRIEITSPGGPYGNITVENFGTPGKVDYRNPELGDVMKNIGLIQRFGTGILITRREMEHNGNPPPEFKVDRNSVCCVLRKKEER